MPQLTYQDQRDLPAFEGGLYASEPSLKVTRSAGPNIAQVSTLVIGAAPTAAVAQVETFTVDTAADGDAFTINIGEFEFTGTTSGTDATATALAISVIMNANEDFLLLYTAVAAVADIVVTALRPGTPFTTQETVDATSAHSWAATTANTPGTQFKIIIDGRELLYAASSTTILTERDALIALLQADTTFALEVVFTTQSTDGIVITALVAGNPHTITFENEDGIGNAGVAATITFVATTANITGNPVPFGRGVVETLIGFRASLPSVTGFAFEGISIARAKGRPKDNTVQPPVTGAAEYRAAEPMDVLRRGSIWVLPEVAVAPGDSVFLRHTVDGGDATNVPGRFRIDADGANADEITNARWLTVAAANVLAVVEINMP